MSIGILLLGIGSDFYWGFIKFCMLFIYCICHSSPPLTEIHSIHFFRFWLLPNLGSCTAIAFHPTKRNELLIATVNSSINLMNIGRLRMDFRLLLQLLWRIPFSGICPHVVQEKPDFLSKLLQNVLNYSRVQRPCLRMHCSS